jgi:hypothetical protein
MEGHKCMDKSGPGVRLFAGLREVKNIGGQVSGMMWCIRTLTLTLTATTTTTTTTTTTGHSRM